MRWTPLSLLVAGLLAGSVAAAEPSVPPESAAAADKALCSYLKDVEAKTGADCTRDSLASFRSKAPATLAQLVENRKTEVRSAYEYLKAPSAPASAAGEKKPLPTQLKPPINNRTFSAWIGPDEEGFKEVYARWLQDQNRRLEQERAAEVSPERRKKIDAKLKANQSRVSALQKITDTAELACFLGENCGARSGLTDPTGATVGGRTWTSSDYERANKAANPLTVVPGGRLDRSVPDVGANDSGEGGPAPAGFPLGRAGAFGGLGLMLGWLASKLFESDARAGTFAGTGAALGLITALATAPAGAGRPAVAAQALLRGSSPNVGLAPGGRPDCVDQLKKTQGLQRDASDKRQTTIVMLQPVLDKYRLSYDQFQSVFPRLLSGDASVCGESPSACRLRMDSRDWTTAQASYGQIQALDRRLLVLSGILAKLGEVCALSDDNDRGPATKRKNGNASSPKSATNTIEEHPVETAETAEAGEQATRESIKEEKPSSRKLGDDVVSSRKIRRGTAIGPSPRYVVLAEDMGLRYFQIPDEVWEKMSFDQRWAANRKFLDRAIARQEPIHLAISIENVMKRHETFLYREVMYLRANGYEVGGSGLMMFPKMK